LCLSSRAADDKLLFVLCDSERLNERNKRKFRDVGIMIV
jgi:hypothetical protein